MNVVVNGIDASTPPLFTAALQYPGISRGDTKQFIVGWHEVGQKMFNTHHFDIIAIQAELPTINLICLLTSRAYPIREELSLYG